MKRPRTLTALFLLVLPIVGISQIRFQAHTGVSYIEHFAIGAGISLKNHNVVAIGSSNFFIETNKFSNLFLQYHFSIPRLQFSNCVPQIGVKGGQSIFSDTYYRWKVVSLIPFIGVQRPLNKRLELFFQVGIAFSFEQSVKRLSYGEIGHYRDKLPEIKAGITLNLTKRDE